MSALPKHVAIIMDGNGRWAQARNKNRYWGHVKGAEVAQEVVEYFASQKKEVVQLTLYAFSTENWSRPQDEVTFLFKLLNKQIAKKKKYMIQNNIKLNVIGNLERLPFELNKNITSVIQQTEKNTGLTLNLALNYGGKQEIITRINEYFRHSEEPLTEEKTNEIFLKDGVTFPDLIIRTSGEMRLSNFMLWQSAYSELYFTKTLWPDFTGADIEAALGEFVKRNRRFGAVFFENESNNEAAL